MVKKEVVVEISPQELEAGGGIVSQNTYHGVLKDSATKGVQDVFTKVNKLGKFISILVFVWITLIQKTFKLISVGCLEYCARNTILDGECYCGEQMCKSTEVCSNHKCYQVCSDESITSSTCYCMHSQSNCSMNSFCNKDEKRCFPVCESINSQIELNQICHCQRGA